MPCKQCGENPAMTQQDRSITLIILKNGRVRNCFYKSYPADHGLCFACFRRQNERMFMAGRQEKLVEMLGRRYE